MAISVVGPLRLLNQLDISLMMTNSSLRYLVMRSELFMTSSAASSPYPSFAGQADTWNLDGVRKDPLPIEVAVNLKKH